MGGFEPISVDEAATRAAGGEVLPNGQGVRIGGWVISSRKAPITADSELERLKESLGVLALPEQYFGGNELRLVHEASGAALAFTARAAVDGWLGDASPRLAVGGARAWQAAREAEMAAHGAKRLDYDWTFTTPYAGEVVLPPPPPAGAAAAANGAAAAPPSEAGALSAAVAAAAAPAWRPSDAAPDRGLLTSRDPILYFDDVPLYESELEDHGASQLSVKVRVMPKCWFVLLRFWLRVDGVAVRLREARLFCRFDRLGVVVREIKYHEGSFAELSAGGAPPEGPAYADAESAALALLAVAPVGVTRYGTEMLMLG